MCSLFGARRYYSPSRAHFCTWRPRAIQSSARSGWGSGYDMATDWKHWSLEERERQYSPSRWSRRLPTADAVVEQHVKLLEEGDHVLCIMHKSVRSGNESIPYPKFLLPCPSATSKAQRTTSCDLNVVYDEDCGQTLDIYHGTDNIT